MPFKIFLDVDVLLDFALKRSGYVVSRRLMLLAVEGKVLAFVTPVAVHMLGYWLSKAYGDDRSRELLLSLLADIRVIDAGHETTLNALHSAMPRSGEAMQYYTALHHKMDYFITREGQVEKAAMPSLPVYSPERFLADCLHVKPEE